MKNCDAGQVTDAARLLSAWVYAWKQFGALPELFDITATNRHPLQKVSYWVDNTCMSTSISIMLANDIYSTDACNKSAAA